MKSICQNFWRAAQFNASALFRLMAPPLCNFVHSEWHFIQGRFRYLADRNNLLTFALVIGKRWENDSWNEENEV